MKSLYKFNKELDIKNIFIKDYLQKIKEDKLSDKKKSIQIKRNLANMLDKNQAFINKLNNLRNKEYKLAKKNAKQKKKDIRLHKNLGLRLLKLEKNIEYILKKKSLGRQDKEDYNVNIHGNLKKQKSIRNNLLNKTKYK